MSETELSDERLAHKFKQEFREQFHILVRMHLSFVLDMNIDDSHSFMAKIKKWPLVPFGKKSKRKDDGTYLTTQVLDQLYSLMGFLKDEKNVKVVGIFRKSGSSIRQQKVKEILLQGNGLEVDCGNYNVHDCIAVFKQILSDLPEPLLTEAHFPAYCQISAISETFASNNRTPAQETKLLTALQLLMLLLPKENKTLFRDILHLFDYIAHHESVNCMTPENLAAIVTPNLIATKKSTVDAVCTKNLNTVMCFMIRNHLELFKIPPKLMLDFRARFEKRKLLQERCLNESATDQCAANTVFTFVDHERTAKENESNTTETALAQLYAHIQSLPESSKKRKLVKQFNKENGHGTPLQVLRSGPSTKNKSFGDSIIRHIFLKRKVPEVAQASPQRQQSPSSLASRARLFCTNISSDESDSDSSSDSAEEPDTKRTKGHDDNGKGAAAVSHPYMTSTPACAAFHARSELTFETPEGQDRKSMSPITRSAQRMPRAMQKVAREKPTTIKAFLPKETMMTPRSRKPVLLVSGTNINALAKMEQHQQQHNYVTPMANLPEEHSEDDVTETPTKAAQASSLTSPFREYLASRSVVTVASSAAVDSSFSSRTDDFKSDDFDLSESKMTESLLHCLEGNDPSVDDSDGGKEPVLKPKQFDENGQPIVFETSF